MNVTAGKAGITAFKIAFVLAVNFAFFLLIPLIHNLFNFLPDTSVENSKQPRIIAEIQKPKKQKKQKKAKRIRQVKASSGKAVSGRTNLKFSPDLGVESGEGVGIQAQQDMEAVVFEEGETDENPVVVFQPPIPYPERAKNAGIEGDLEMTYVVNRSGRVEQIEFPQTPDPSFTKEARKTMRQWRFKPGKNKGVPVKVRVRQVASFKLE